MHLETVRNSAKVISQAAKHVQISSQGVFRAAGQLDSKTLQYLASPAAFDAETHFCDQGPLTAQYLLVVDALNFCFWPEAGLNYENLAKGVKAALQRDAEALSAHRLASISEAGVQGLFSWSRPVPLQSLRAELLHEIGTVLAEKFEGQAASLVRQANGSAAALVQLVVDSFPGFRDTAIYRGQEVAFYKRAQIFVGDLWGAFQGKGLGCFKDVEQLTMFADYRVPAVLREMAILQYSPELAAKVDDKLLLQAGSEEELEIRGCTIQAVEDLKHEVAKIHGDKGVPLPHTIQLDWWLWEQGEAAQHRHRPHHRTLTHFY